MRKLRFNLTPATTGFLFIGLMFYIAYIFLVSIDYFHYTVRADDFRLTALHLIPFHEGYWKFNMLWSDTHPNPIHGLILIYSALYENLSFASLPYIVFPFMIIKWLIYCKTFSINQDRNYNDFSQRYIIYIIFGFIVFSVNFSGQYYWNSVAIANIYHSIGAAYLAILLVAFRNQKNATAFVLMLFALFFHIVARQYSLPWVIASILVLIMYAFLNCTRRDDVLRSLKLIMVLVASLLLEQAFYSLINIDLIYSSNSQSLIESISQNWWHRKFELILFLMGELAAPIVQPSILIDKLNIPFWLVISAIVLISILIALAAVICLINRDDNRYLIPLIMIVFVSLTILAGLAHRTDIETNWLTGHWPRYNVFKSVSLIAVVWVASNQILAGGWSKRLGALMIAIFITVFIPAQAVSIYYNQASLQYKRIALKETNKQLLYTYKSMNSNPNIGLREVVSNYENTHEAPFKLRIGDYESNQKSWGLRMIKFWGDNELNVFSTGFEKK